MGNQDKPYIVTQAEQIFSQLTIDLRAASAMKERAELARYLWAIHHHDIRLILCARKELHVGKMAMRGAGREVSPKRTTMLDVRPGEGLSFGRPGVDIVEEVAAVALTAALTDLVWAHIEGLKNNSKLPRGQSDDGRFGQRMPQGPRLKRWDNMDPP